MVRVSQKIGRDATRRRRPAAAGAGGPKTAPGRGVRARGPREATSLPRSGASRDI